MGQNDETFEFEVIAPLRIHRKSRGVGDRFTASLADVDGEIDVTIKYATASAVSTPAPDGNAESPAGAGSASTQGAGTTLESSNGTGESQDAAETAKAVGVAAQPTGEPPLGAALVALVADIKKAAPKKTVARKAAAKKAPVKRAAKSAKAGET